MKIGLWSDLHGEFSHNLPEALANLTINPEWELLVIAGDLGYIHQHTVALLKEVGSRLGDRPLLFVPGNHEYYRCQKSIRESNVFLKKELAAQPNIHILDNDIFEYQGRRFLGTTLWFPSSPLTELNSRMLNDYHQIERFSAQLKVENEKAVNFLRSNLTKNDVVITHHLPSHRSEAPRFKHTDFSIFFVCDSEYLIADRQPSFWLHGHTHDSMNYDFMGCQVICNPKGYPHDLNPDFKSELVIEI